MSDCQSCAARGGCPSAAANAPCPSQVEAEPQKAAPGQNEAQPFEKMPPAEGASVKYVLAVASGKGGVGKSLVVSLLAVQLRRLGLNVGILDADMTGPSIPLAFGVQGQMASAAGERLILPVRSAGGIQIMSINVLLDDPTAPVVWRGPVIASVVKQFWQEVLWENLDVLLIDMPPGTGDVPLTVYQLLPVDALVLVATPQDLVTMIVKKAKRMANSLSIPLLGLIENMASFVCPNCNETHALFGGEKTASAAAALDVPLLAELPLDPRLTELVDAGAIEQMPGQLLGDAALKICLALRERDAAASPEA